jgi:hypothetical protein
MWVPARLPARRQSILVFAEAIGEPRFRQCVIVTPMSSPRDIPLLMLVSMCGGVGPQPEPRERIAARLGDDPGAHALVQAPGDGGAQQRRGVAVIESFDDELRQGRVIVGRPSRASERRLSPAGPTKKRAGGSPEIRPKAVAAASPWGVGRRSRRSSSTRTTDATR